MIQRRETQAASLPKDIKQNFEQIELDVYVSHTSQTSR